MISNLSYSPETVKLGCDLCDLDLWPWPFAWTLRWSLVITPENFMMIRWWEHRHRENFWAFTGPRIDFDLILLILNMIIHRSFTGPTHLLSANVRGPVSFAVSGEHSQKGVTDRRTEQTENTICRAAWSQLKTIGHLFYATSSFEHHFLAIGVFKLELQSGNAQFGSNSPIFRAVWPWNLTDDIEKQ